MSSTHRIVTACAAAVALAAPASAAATTLATYDGAPVAQRAGVQVWSRTDGKDRYVLMVRSGGTVSQAPVPAQRVPFAVSMDGGDAAHPLVALYPRCHRVDGLYGGDCRLVEYDVAARRERPIAHTHAAGASEEAVARNFPFLAYARRTGTHSTVLIRRVGSGHRARVVLRIPGEAFVTGMALSPQALAFSVDAFPGESPGESRLYVKRAGRPVRQVARGGFGEENRREHESPSADGRYVYWAYANQSEVAPANGWVARCDLRTGRTTTAEAPGYLDGVAVDAVRRSAPLLVTSFSQRPVTLDGVDQVATLDTPAWGPAPAALSLAAKGPCGR